MLKHNIGAIMFLNFPGKKTWILQTPFSQYWFHPKSLSWIRYSVVSIVGPTEWKGCEERLG